MGLQCPVIGHGGRSHYQGQRACEVKTHQSSTCAGIDFLESEHCEFRFISVPTIQNLPSVDIITVCITSLKMPLSSFRAVSLHPNEIHRPLRRPWHHIFNKS